MRVAIQIYAELGFLELSRKIPESQTWVEREDKTKCFIENTMKGRERLNKRPDKHEKRNVGKKNKQTDAYPGL